MIKTLIPVVLFGAAAFLFLRKKRDFAAETLVNQVLGRDHYLVDVRTKEEFHRGHVKNAENIPLNELRNRIEGFARDKNRPVLVYCGAGVRSQRAKNFLEKIGYSEVLNLGGLERAQILVSSHQKSP